MAKFPGGKVFEGPWRSEEYPDPEDQLKDAMRKAGIVPPDKILLDGKMHRFSSSGKAKDDAGWYIIYGDNIPAGGYGCWRQNINNKFVGKIHRELTAAEQIQSSMRIQEAMRAREEAVRLKNESAAETVELIWSMAEPAERMHEYLQKKGIGVNGARMTGDGRLILPIYDRDGDLSSLQYVDTEGGKRYHAGGAVKGGYNIIGDITQDKVFYIAEGFATAATAHEITGITTVTAYSAGNLEPVAGLFRERFPEAKIVIIADNDESGIGKHYADQAAAKHRCTIIMPPTPGDINDYKQQGGNVMDLLVNVETKLKYYYADQIPEEYQAPEEIIENFLGKQSVAVLYSDSNSGKTFFALSIAGAISNGDDFMGRRLKNGVVVYLAAEAPETIKARIQAMHKHHGIKYSNIAVIGYPVNFAEGIDDVNEVIEAINRIKNERGEVSLVIADTLARIAAGANENAANEMAPVMQRFDMIKDQTGAAVLIIHHSGKDQARGSRGWSGIRAHVDTEMEITQSGKIHTCKITKQRALPSKGEDVNFKLHVIEMGVSQWGTPATNCVAIVTDEKPETGQEKKDKRIEERHMERFAAAWIKSKMEYSSNDYPYVTTAAVMRYLVDDEGLREGAARTAAKPSGGKFITQLIKCGKIECFLDGYIATDNDFCQKLEFKRMGENAKK